MKIAMFTGGHPRFTEDFFDLVQRLTGFESADLYFNFWESDWVNSVDEGSNRIKSILPNNFKLAKLQIVKPPPYSLPPTSLEHLPPQPENIRWWYERRIGQFKSLAMAYELIEGDYDLVIRFRPDGAITASLDLSTVDLSSAEIILPKNGCGYSQWPINDQFAIGTYKGLSFYKTIAENFNQLVIESDPQWEYNGHGKWAGEHLIGYYLNKNQISYQLGKFDHVLTTRGRSKYTDKHYHLPITRDITK